MPEQVFVDSIRSDLEAFAAMLGAVVSRAIDAFFPVLVAGLGLAIGAVVVFALLDSWKD